MVACLCACVVAVVREEVGWAVCFASRLLAHPNVAATHRPARPFSDNMGLAAYAALRHASLARVGFVAPLRVQR